MKCPSMKIISILMLVKITYSLIYSNCNERPAYGRIESLKIVGCDMKKDRCILQRGSNITLIIHFVSLANVNKSEAVYSGIFGPLEAKEKLEIIWGQPKCEDFYNKIGQPICKNSVHLYAGKRYYYAHKIRLYKAYPKIDMAIRFIIREAANELTESQKRNWLEHPGKIILCFQMPIKFI